MRWKIFDSINLVVGEFFVQKKLKYDVSEHAGYIKARVLSRYFTLPQQLKDVHSVDDCVQDAILYTHRVLNRLDGCTVKYDPTKSKLTTFIAICVNSYFNALLTEHHADKRSAVMVSLDATPIELSVREVSTSFVTLREAREKIQELHLQASPALIDFIAKNLYHPRHRLHINRTPEDFVYKLHRYTKRPRKVPCEAGEILTKRKQEFRQLANRLGVTADHYRMVLRTELT